MGGLSVALILIPQAIAYAEIAGLTPAAGLAAAALPAMAAAPFASSRYLQTGPVAMTALLAYGSLSTLAEPGTTEYLSLAMTLALVVGVFRVGLGLAKAGAITNYMSPPVVLGFTTSAAILISATQVGHIVGLAGVPDALLGRLWHVVANVDVWNWHAVALSAGTLVIVIGSRRIHPLVPGVLLTVLAGVAIGALTSYSGTLVGGDPAGFGGLSLAFAWTRIPDLIVPALVIATIGFAEATAIARTFALVDREKWDPSQELVGQGVANVAAAVSGGFPVGGSFSRSSINRLAGARSRWAGFITGTIVLLFMPFAGILTSLPRAVLSGIVIAAVYQLIRVDDIVRMFRVSPGQAIVASSTALVTLALSPRVDLAVLLGMLIAAVVHLFRESEQLRIDVSRKSSRLTLSPRGVLFYATAGALYETLQTELANHDMACESVELNLDHLGRIDYTGVQALQTFAETSRSVGVDVTVVNVPDHTAKLLERAGGI